VVTDNDALIVWDTDENATGQVHYGTASTLYTDSSDLVSTYNRAHAITLSNLNTSTLYYYVVVSADSSGNSTTSSEYTFTTLEALSEESEVELREQAAAEAARAEGILEGTSSRRGGGGGASVDRTAPVVSNLSITNISDSGATISWSATEASVGIVEFGLSTTYAKSTLNVPLSLVEEHVVTLTDLDPETTYFISATALDNSFNRSTALVDSFTTLAEGEVPSEEDPLVSPEDTATLPREETEKIFTESLQRAGEILRVMSTEVGVGALESNLSEQALLIQELASLLPVPIISGSPQVEVGTTFANISWTTDKPSNSLVSYAPESVYALTGEYEQTVGDFDTMVVSHSVSLRGLLPGTVYHYRLSSRTITGSETNSRDFIFTTSDEVSEITSYRTTIASPAQTSFTWVTTVPTDSVITYIPYQNGVPNIAAKKSVRNNIFTTQHTLDISDFESGVLYDIELSGTDVGGNIVSKLIQGYSTDGQDLPPVISQIKTENALLPGGKERVQTIISWNTNELSTSRVYYRKGFASDDTPFTDSTLLDTEYVRKHVVVISNFESGQVYQFAVESTDSGGNTAVSKTITILTPRKEESVFQVIMSNVEDIFSWAGKIRR
jgi:hypothetical protein